LQGKEEAPEATTNQTIEVTQRSSSGRRKPDGTKISVGTDGVDDFKMEQTQLALMFLVVSQS
jgi:hypothetical protein